jgi:hypothetical protein
MSASPSTASPLQLFSKLPEPQREQMLQTLDDSTKANLAYEWRRWIARPNQLAPAGDWRYWLVKAGRGFGKTRVGAEWVREQVRDFGRVNLIGKDAADMRSVMIEGESGILACCPPWERPEYLPSKRMLRWPNGAVSEFRTGEDPDGLRGLQSERLWADEIAAWQYPQEAWDMAVLGLRIGPDPRACVTTTPRPIRLVRELMADPNVYVTNGATYDNLANLAPAFADQIIRKYEGTRLGKQELLGELLEDEGLAYRFNEQIHVVAPFQIPEGWERFECMDFGSTNPTAWYAVAVDYDGNLIVYGEFYEPGLPSETAPKIHALRRVWHGNEPPVCWADPSVYDDKSVTNKWGRAANVADEFNDHGIHLVRANNDRRAGFVRISELLRLTPGRTVPGWANDSGLGSPSLFVFAGCPNLIEQLRDAPLEEADTGPHKGPYPGEAVARGWEGAYGHAHAALRYGVMSRPDPSVRHVQPLDDPRAELMRQVEARRVSQAPSRYDWNP